MDTNVSEYAAATGGFCPVNSFLNVIYKTAPCTRCAFWDGFGNSMFLDQQVFSKARDRFPLKNRHSRGRRSQFGVGILRVGECGGSE
nr:MULTISPECIES: hypothetical protein [Nostocaceae]